MSVLEKDKIDAIGINKDSSRIILMISDHLSWDKEHEHLILLQEKVNSYINFIEDKQFKVIYPNIDISEYTIEIHFKYSITKNCYKFLEVVNKKLNKLGITVVSLLPEGT
ncbi:hypothetical protein CSC2_09320 [Clostridium zeae]|uniref:Branched-chain amino acid ABC transporter substrate-binding protein n=1 Tax=Clostridium zeae TaxID=2759022 RepID=A0ABQ1E6L0_9CLOT|nr:DUF6572 domain-containing protein [Clostridium zeae]GFZ30406.1 hypothetical protein CSC2_09320 [Clostridium zeae]